MCDILRLKMSKDVFNDMVAYTEEKIKRHNEIFKEIDEGKDANQSRLNAIFWTDEKETVKGTPIKSKRPGSCIIRNRALDRLID